MTAALATIIVEGEPLAKARPRFKRTGGTYSDPRQTANAATLGWHFRRACKTPADGPVRMDAAFYRSTRHRIDLDNLLKQAMDAANGIAWRDDSQVIEIHAWLLLDRERPRSVIELREAVAS